MRKTCVSSVLAVAALTASAPAAIQAVGNFNGWDNGTGVVLGDLVGGVWGANIPSTGPGINEFKLNIGDWSPEVAAGNHHTIHHIKDLFQFR